MIVDLLFPASGGVIPTDHAYPLYAALSRAVPAFHDPASGLRFAPLTGLPGERGRLRLTDRSLLRVRVPSGTIPTVLPLAGMKLDVAGPGVRLGPPTVRPLVPATAVESWLVTFNCGEVAGNDAQLGAFLATGRAKLKDLNVGGELGVRVFEAGERVGQPRRRVVRVKGAAIVGYAVMVSGLTADESVRLQERGLGGRTKIGCGFFLPARGD